jgi:DNA gyrase subunit A
MPLVQVLQLGPEESVQTMLTVPSLQDEGDLLLATRMGEIKRMALISLTNIRTNGIRAMDMEPGDELVSVRLGSEEDDIIMVSGQGMSIRFPAAQVRRSSRASGGVRGMRLKDEDTIVAMDMVVPEGQLLVVSQRGYGKPTTLDRYRLQSRGGYGLKTFRITSKSGPVATARVVKEGEEILIISQRGQRIRSSLSEIRVLSRRTQGVSIFTLAEDDSVVSIASMERRTRTARDTRPRAASGQPEDTVELSVEEPEVNGHRNGHHTEEEQPEA